MGEKDRLKKVLFFKDPNRISDALHGFGIDDYSGKQTLIKIHMGEVKNKYFSKPEFVKLVVDVLLRKSAKPFLYDTTVLYNSRRRYVEGYGKVADMHGFTDENIGCGVIIDDEGIPVVVEGNTYFVGNKLYEVKHIVGISHFKGHIASGMGATLKNFGMGGVTRESKKFMHHGCKPIFNEENCCYCGVCSELCPFEAIEVKDESWNIKEDACFGCGVCIENCKYDAIRYVRNDLSYYLACSTKACVEKKKVIYINDVNRIARNCDCDPDSGPIICPDIGYFMSDDPVAVDAASLDSINKVKPDVFQDINKVDPYKQIRYGEKIGLGSSSYELINL